MLKKLLGLEKCCICKELDGILNSTNAHGIYGEVGRKIYFHTHCLKTVTNDPEAHTHLQVDAALNIIRLIECWASMEKRNEKKAEENRTKLSSYKGKVLKVIEL